MLTFLSDGFEDPGLPDFVHNTSQASALAFPPEGHLHA
jgi:hypothetical protein